MSEKETRKSSPITTCPVCSSNSLENQYHDLDVVCRDCGYVIHNLEHRSGLLAKLSNPEDEHRGTEEVGWLEYCKIQNATEQRLAVGIDILDSICQDLNIDIETRIRGAELFGEATQERLTDGRDAKIVLTASIYCAAKERRSPLPVNVLAGAAGIDSSQLHRVIQILNESLDLDLGISGPVDFLPYLRLSLELSDQQADEIVTLLDETRSFCGMSGKNPAGIVAAATYAVSSDSLTQSQVSDAAGISAETLRVRLAEFREVGIID